MREKFRHDRWKTVEASSGAEAFEFLHDAASDLLLLDPGLPDLEALEFSSLVAERFPHTEILTVDTATGRPFFETAKSTQLSKQLKFLFQPQELPAVAKAVFAPPTEQLRPVKSDSLPGIIGESESMRAVASLAQMVAQRDTTVLVTGESGTGKDLFSQAIHSLSARARKPFVVINCAAIPEALLEAELFGYTKGSFTGAMQPSMGRIQAAHGGTLFLDEIGDMPLSLQSKILRFLEQGEVQRIGSAENHKVNVRVIAATNADIQGMVKQKLFREDLYYRLGIFPIRLPPLRERPGDIPLLAASLLASFHSGIRLASEAVQKLEQHEWPGNVRELRNVMERASIIAQDENEVGPRHVVF
jgi:transcriptional regulator with PAS, ATPase and Fis domain